jgi:hypothetical protein
MNWQLIFFIAIVVLLGLLFYLRPPSMPEEGDRRVGTECELTIFKSATELQARVQFYDWGKDDWGPTVFLFRDAIIEKVKQKENLELLKEENYPTSLDSDYLLLKKDIFDQTKASLQALRESPKVEHPGFLNFLFKTEKYRQWTEYKERGNRELERILNVYSFEATTSHDYPGVTCDSEIHTSEQLRNIIREVARELKLDLEEKPDREFEIQPYGS